MPTKKQTKADAEIHKKALERYKESSDKWNDIYEQAQKDIDFLLDNKNAQWDDGRDYEPEKLQLVINKCESEVDAIVNEMRAARPSVRTNPSDDKGDEDTSEVLNGLIRNIEHVSDAATAYDTAAYTQVGAGIGWVRLGLEWIKGTFEQEPVIETVNDFASVIIDHLSTELDGSDMRYGFVVRENVSMEEFEQTYPNANPIDLDAGKTSGWAEDGTVRIAEYFYREKEKQKLYLVTKDGEKDVLLHSRREELEKIEGYALEDLGKGQADPMDGRIRIVREREEEVDLIRWCKINGQEILEKTDWIGEHIPLVPVYGRMTFNRGKRHVSGLIKVLRDPQRLLNYWESSHTEVIAAQPKAPYIAAEGQLEDYEQMWKDSSRKNYPALIYKNVDLAGRPVPPPQRAVPPQMSMAMYQMSQSSLQHFKSVTGKIYDEGQKTLGSESGKAVIAKERKSDVASFHYMDNQAKSIRMVGKILVDIIPKVYSGKRIVRVLGEDGSKMNVPINQQVDQPVLKRPSDAPEFKGIYDLNVGKYDVTVDVGPSFASRRNEATEAMIELTRVVPDVMGVAADLIVRGTDWPGKDELADRLKKSLPPDIANEDLSPEQVALDQAKQAMEVMKGKLMQMEGALKDKKRSEDMKYQIDLMKTQIDSHKVEIEAVKAAAELEDSVPSEDFRRIAQKLLDSEAMLMDIGQAFELLLDADTEGSSQGEPPPVPPPGASLQPETEIAAP